MDTNTQPPAAQAPAAAALQPPAQTPPALPWLPDADPDTVGYVQNKAWQGPGDALKAYRDLERTFGADRAGRTFTIPKDDDQEGWNQVWSKLGRPESADAYQLPVPQGVDTAFSAEAAKWFHEAGVPVKQAQKLAAKWNEYMGSQAQAQEQQEAQALAAERAQLEADWGTGQAAAMQHEIARRAAVKLGMDEASIGALEKTVGYSKVMKLFAKVGELTGEHKAEGLGQGGSFRVTPEQAKARKSQLMADPAWRSKAMNPKSAEWAELQTLDMAIAQMTA